MNDEHKPVTWESQVGTRNQTEDPAEAINKLLKVIWKSDFLVGLLRTFEFHDETFTDPFNGIQRLKINF